MKGLQRKKKQVFRRAPEKSEKITEKPYYRLKEVT
jgi:hypothetical protein